MNNKPAVKKRATRAKRGSQQQQQQQQQRPFDWSGVFPPGRIKTQIQAADPDLGCLPQKSLQLISTCSALLLRKVVCSAKEESSKDQVIVLSAKDIQEGVHSDPSLNFLNDTVDDALQSEDNKLAQRKDKKQKASTQGKKPAKRAKKAEETLGVSKECLEQAVQVSKQESTQKQDKIIMDEEDYD